MKVTIVTFQVFGKSEIRVYLKNETPEQIHDELNRIWPTYHVQSIITANDATFQPLNTITKFQTDINHV